MQVPLEWKMSVSGNNQVKSVMNDLNSALARGQISTSDYADSQAKLAATARKVNSSHKQQNDIFMAMHPNVNKLSRSFSTFASIARTTLALMNSINLILIAQNTQSSSLAKVTAEMAEKQRELDRTQDPVARQKLIEDMSILRAKMEELKNQDMVTYWESWITGIIGAGLFANIFLKHIGTISTALATGLGGAALATVLGLAAAFVAVAAAGFFVGRILGDFVNTALEKWDFFYWSKIEPMLVNMIDFFTVAIPNAVEVFKEGVIAGFIAVATYLTVDLPNALRTLAGGAIGIFNTIIGAVEGLINTIIDGINRLIMAYNAVASKLGLGKLALLQHVSFDRLTLPEAPNKAANGPQQQGPSNTYITVQGSILTERELMNMVDDNSKQSFKRRGLAEF